MRWIQKNEIKQEKYEVQRYKEQINVTLPIQDNDDLDCEGREKLVVFVTSTSLRHTIFLHYLIFLIGEVFEPTIFFEIVTYVLKVRGPYIQNGLITHKHLDEELVSLHKTSTVKL